MNTLFKILVFVFIMAGLTTFIGCNKEAEVSAIKPIAKNPALTTTGAFSITTTTAVTGGTVTSRGSLEIAAWGVCWSTLPNPIIADNNISVNLVGTGSFTCLITDLIPNTTYYIRAYVTNSVETTYGNEITFNSKPEAVLATLTTIAVTDITAGSAVSGGNITDDGEGSLTEWGICWSTSESPTTDNWRYNITGGSGGERMFSFIISGLKPGTTYFVRAYAINSAGPAYGDQLIFTTYQNPGIKITDFPGSSSYDAASFSIGTKAYIGLGYDSGDGPTRDFWEWDQTTNLWTRKADFPGSLTGAGDYVCFSIGTKGYVETGGTFYADINQTIPNEFWEYDPLTNTWTKKATLPFTPGRKRAIGFSIGTKGYIGIGGKVEGLFDSYYQDFWEWDQETNVWMQKADFPGNSRIAAIGFSIGNKGYIGTGSDGTTSYKDFWEWDQATNVWTQKADFGGVARYSAVGFSIGNKGYIGIGNGGGPSWTSYTDIWEWKQATNEWTQMIDFGGKAGGGAVGFSIRSKGYIGLGYDGASLSRDFWELDLAFN